MDNQYAGAAKTTKQPCKKVFLADIEQWKSFGVDHNQFKHIIEENSKGGEENKETLDNSKLQLLIDKKIIKGTCQLPL